MDVANESWVIPYSEAVLAVREGEISGDDFLRAAMHHPRWLVAGHRADSGLALGVIRKPGGGTIVECFSSPEAVLDVERSGTGDFTGSLVELTGFELFGAVATDVRPDRLNLDPGSAHYVHYKVEQLDMLGAWSEMARLEAALYTPDHVTDPLGAICEFDGYHVVIQGAPEDGAFVLAPDPEGRALGAVFTSFDTAQSFAATVGAEANVELSPAAVSTAHLFETLSAMDLDGLVFNPWSELPARALSAGVLGPVLERVRAS